MVKYGHHIGFIMLASLTMHLSGKRVLPQFTGTWYDQAALAKYDACGIAYWNYVHQANDKNVILAALFQALPMSAQCIWNTPYEVNAGVKMPTTFPGNFPDYSQIIKDPAQPRVQTSRSDCINVKTKAIDKYAFLEVQPSYSCPKDSVHTGGFCAANSICTADVVGRDLNYKGLGWLGHIALGFPSGNGDEQNAQVLEVLNQHRVINFNSLGSFKTISPYWGAVYGLDDSGFVDPVKANSVIKAGVDQMQFEPEYTMTAQWQAGHYSPQLFYDRVQNKFITESAIVRGIFRCDTFVNYCYKVGFGVQLPKPDRFLDVLPRSTFNSFSFKHETASMLTEGRIVAAEDSITAESRASNHTARFIWQSAQQADTYTFLNAMDVLSTLASHELIPDLIQTFKTERNAEKRKKLVTAIVKSAHALSQEGTIHNTQKIEAIVDAQDFVLKVLETESDFSVLGHTIYHTLSILPKDWVHYELISHAMSRLQEHPVMEHRLSNEKKFLILLSIALANDTMQTRLLPTLLLSAKSDDEKIAFDTQLLFILRHLLPSTIAPHAQAMLGDYLNGTNTMNTVDRTFALATIYGETGELREKELARLIVHTSDSQEQAELINHLDLGVFSHISKTDQKLLYKNCHDGFVQAYNTDKEYLFGTAMMKLHKAGELYHS